mmetsp:Transcript_24438/g.75681  ORF Transcript_24438/g.75681 Transcript_24438/m.75681 type:complete len:208 (+) Transcript_24438:677-1300(+)
MDACSAVRVRLLRRQARSVPLLAEGAIGSDPRGGLCDTPGNRHADCCPTPHCYLVRPSDGDASIVRESPLGKSHDTGRRTERTATIHQGVPVNRPPCAVQPTAGGSQQERDSGDDGDDGGAPCRCSDAVTDAGCQRHRPASRSGSTRRARHEEVIRTTQPGRNVCRRPSGWRIRHRRGAAVARRRLPSASDGVDRPRDGVRSERCRR